MSNYSSLFNTGNGNQEEQLTPDSLLDKLIESFNTITPYTTTTYLIHDYRIMGYKYLSSNIFDLTGYFPEQFYDGGFDFGIKQMHPHDIPEILILQNKMFSISQKLSLESKKTLTTRFSTRLYNRATDTYQRVKKDIRPICFDDQNNTILEIASITLATPLIDYKNKFEWEISYRDKDGRLVVESSNSKEEIPENLTNAEVNIFKMLKRGLTSNEISEQLNISSHTVDTHRRKILKKLQVKNTRELLVKYSD